tara:strand:+ start:63 stop:512 length:450 start_codon:yes stop_codon:yes gene_type:complete
MYIQTEKINNQIEPVLFTDTNKPLMVIPSTKGNDGQRYMKLHYLLESYMSRKAAGKPIQPGETKRVFELIRNYNSTGKWEPTQDDWKKSLDELIEHNDYMSALDNHSKIGALKKFIKSCETEIETTCKIPPTNKRRKVAEAVYKSHGVS